MKSSSGKLVAIILLNYNSYDYTEACVKSLNEISYDNYKIIIVDNCSTDDSFSKLVLLESNSVHIIKSKKNGGFAYGNNIGIKYAMETGAQYFLLLNNDTLVEKDFLDRLVSSAITVNSDITTCRIMYNSDRQKLWYGGGEIDWFRQRAIHTGINEIYEAATKNQKQEVTFASGCCMLLSKRCVDRIGGLPEEYFMYYEDLDYCQNALNNQLHIVYDPDSVIYHCVSASGGGSRSPFVIEWSNRSRRRFMIKYKNNTSWIIRIIGSVLCELREIIKIIISTDRIRCFRAYFRSFSSVNS